MFYQNYVYLCNVRQGQELAHTTSLGLAKFNFNLYTMNATMKVINLDEIRPKQYKSNIERYGEDGCIICGRPLSERDMENGKFVHMLPNGDITDSQELDGKIPDNADLGWWQVGCTCYKNFLKAANTKPVKTWMVENGYSE